MTKAEKRIREQYGYAIADMYQEQDGEQFGKAYGTYSWWIELKAGYALSDGTEMVHESTLKDCESALKHLVRV
jgi:hypothetical protein